MEKMDFFNVNIWFEMVIDMIDRIKDIINYHQNQKNHRSDIEVKLI